MRIREIIETSLYVDDLAAAESFYNGILGLEVVRRSEGRGIAFRCGSAVLLVADPDVTIIPDRAVPATGAKGPGHVAFGVGSHLDELREHLERCGVEIETEVWHGGHLSIYVRDPAGNSVEFGVDASGWFEPTEQLAAT